MQKYVFKTNKKSGKIVKFITQKIWFSKQKNRKRGIETVKFILAKIRFSKQNKTNKKRCGEIVKFITQKIRFSKQKTEKGAFSNTNRCDFCQEHNEKPSQKQIANKREAG